MIAVSPPLPPTALAATQTPVPAVGGAPRGFGQTLEAFLDARDKTDPQPDEAVSDDRQGVADDGKTVPPSPDGDDPSGGPSDGVAAPIWFPPTPVQTSAPTLPASAGEIDLASAPLARSADASFATAASRPAAAPVPVPAKPSLKLASDAVGGVTQAGTSVPLSTAEPPPAQSIAPTIGDHVTQAEAKGAPVAARLHADSTPVALVPTDPSAPAITVTATPQPAGQVFAAAMAASTWHERIPRTTEPGQSDAAAALGIAASAQPSEQIAVKATGDSGGTALDLTQDSGLQRMIDRIETLHDDASDRANARDTRIRLIPDALGSVDVSVRQEGDRVHVHFTAGLEATRTLLADAQPRLTDLAAARGVRIGGTSVSADTAGGSGTTPQPRPVPAIARTPAPAAHTETPADARIA